MIDELRPKDAEQRQIKQIRSLKEAINKTTSEKLKRDYRKAIKRKKAELLEYRKLYYSNL